MKSGVRPEAPYDSRSGDQCSITGRETRPTSTPQRQFVIVPRGVVLLTVAFVGDQRVTQRSGLVSTQRLSERQAEADLLGTQSTVACGLGCCPVTHADAGRRCRA